MATSGRVGANPLAFLGSYPAKLCGLSRRQVWIARLPALSVAVSPGCQAVLRMLLVPGFLVPRLRHHPLGRRTPGSFCAGFVVHHTTNEEFGRKGRTRTCDRSVPNRDLYQLSYFPRRPVSPVPRVPPPGITSSAKPWPSGPWRRTLSQPPVCRPAPAPSRAWQRDPWWPSRTP